MMRRIGLPLLTLAGLLPSLALADRTLDSESSSLSYVTNKAGAIAELNSFGKLSGAIEGQQATLEVDLASVDTAIEIRDERMRDILFKVAEYPLATASLEVPDQLEAMEPGESRQEEFQAELQISGSSASVPVELRVTRLKDGGLLVQNVKPLVLNAASFGLSEGVEELREIAGLPSINNNVVVSFSLQFNED